MHLLNATATFFFSSSLIMGKFLLGSVYEILVHFQKKRFFVFQKDLLLAIEQYLESNNFLVFKNVLDEIPFFLFSFIQDFNKLSCHNCFS